MNIEDQENVAKNRYVSGAIAVNAIFSATETGKSALDFLDELFCTSYFDTENAESKALYQQGQASVMYEIKSMIRNVEMGVYNGNE